MNGRDKTSVSATQPGGHLPLHARQQGTQIPLVLLAGGKGTRLASLEPNRPKPMVLVDGKPFLHWLVEHYERLGYRDYVFSIGHLAEVVETYDWNGSFPTCRFRFAREDHPLGSGGAVQKIFAEQGLAQAWVINGDTFLPQPLPEPASGLEAFYTVLKSDSIFDATPNLRTEGTLVVSEGKNGHYFDGGAVFVSKSAVDRYKGSVPCSIHALLAPAMAAQQVGYAALDGTCYDIGTPERYHRFEAYLKKRTKG